MAFLAIIYRGSVKHRRVRESCYRDTDLLEILQVQFKEGKFKPPEIKSSIDLPENINIFGQNISLSRVQQSLNPLQNAVEGITRTISGQPPLKVPIPGERTKSWLLITYLDKDFRISRGDGGVFVLVKEGSSLLN